MELDDGDPNATLISMYLSVSANCLADFIEKADAFTEFAMLDSALRKFDSDEVDGFFCDYGENYLRIDRSAGERRCHLPLV